MKLQILDITGKNIREIETELFEEPIREDIIARIVEAEKIKTPVSPKYRAGMDRSASGNITKRRHVWKSDRGKGLARLPRKIMWRRGTQFNWVAAIVPGTRGGRRAHPPKSNINDKKINKKELKKALLSALSYVSDVEKVKNKYSTLMDKKIEMNFPLVIEEKILKLNTKQFLESLKEILKDFYDVAIQKKSIRAGIGKMRGRKYKKNAGLLFVIGNKENKSIKGIEVLKVNQLIVSDLASNGSRLTLFSENAIKDLEKIMSGKSTQIKKEKKISKKKNLSSIKINKINNKK